jgi:flagella basal body P-ring formation protein FlgA
MTRNKTSWSLTIAMLLATMAPIAAQDAPVMPAPPGAQELTLPPPPPPPPDRPPAVDLTRLAELRGARGAAIPAPRAVAAASPALTSILRDVGRQAGGRCLLESQLFEQLRRALPGSEEYLLEQATIPDFLRPSDGGWTVDYEFRLPTGGVGRATYTASLHDPATGDTQRFSGTVMIDREAKGVTVTRLVRRGETIGARDVQTLAARLSQLPRGALDVVEVAIGTKARKELRPGEWLTDQVVATPDLVRRGQAVTMRLSRGSLTITAPGIVQQPGGRGQVVRVQNAQSKKDLFAKVVSKDEVQVQY